jgi:oligoendopeptidase F
MAIIKRKVRRFIPEDFKVTTWEALQPYFEELQTRLIDSEEGLRAWFKDRSELESIVSEDMAWRYIKMTCDTANQELVDHYTEFVTDIQPKIAPVNNKLNKKAIDNKFIGAVEGVEGYDIMIRGMKTALEIYRDENVPLQTEIQQNTQKYGQLSGAMSIEHNSKEMTLQQAAVLLQSTDRVLREEIYHKISRRRLDDKSAMDDLYHKLIGLRNQVANNAGFDNFRDYMFSAMGRFDYTPQDCFDFHVAVAEEVVPLLNDSTEDRKQRLGFEILKPWDKSVDADGASALSAFDGGEDLLEKSIQCFANIDPYLGECLETMKEMGHLDLVSRKGKSPGGYNYPLSEIGVPFIFMNATSTLRDMVTLMHEGGHAVHSFLTKDLELGDFKHTPSEVAELASMSMELISMDQWHLFFDNPEDLKRAKKEHLTQIIETLPWVATIDKFQHWIYEYPTHTVEERLAQWNVIFDQFADDVTSWEGLTEQKNYLWQRQLHLYEVPFYYIEYGMAQLGAVAVWKNYKENPVKGLDGYLNALKLGYKKSIPEVYAAADIKFDFSKAYIKDLMTFVREELGKI